jgi:hypothetical protein
LLFIGILTFYLHLKREKIFFETLEKMERGEIESGPISSSSLLCLKIAWICATGGVFLLSMSIIGAI